MFLILMVTCSTYYLHWTHGPDIYDHEKYRFRKHVNVEAHQDVSEVVKDPPKTVVNPPVLRKQPVSTTHFAAPKEVPTEDTIVVTVPTHNRIGYVQLTSSALRGTFPAEDIWIFDDKSSEYSTNDLLEWYGTKHVWQSIKRIKADAMARHILEWFLSTKYDVLVLLDSDLLVSPNWHVELQKGLRKSTGLLSLYRSAAPKHKSLSCGDVLCQQPSMGNAGTVWRRDLAKRMLAEMSARDGGFDWGWSKWCTKNKVPMEALKESAVLHIGMHGSWSHETSAEKSVGFPMKELSVDVRQRAEHFLKGAKPTSTPTKAAPTWQSFENVWLPTYYQMAYANPEARTPNDLEKVKQTCIKLGCVAVTVEQNGWLAYFRNIPVDKSKWEPKSRSTMWVVSKYLSGQEKQPDMKYGCSRHAHACRRDPEPGSAPCCAHVMLEIMSDMSRVLRKHNIHWRLTQGQQLSVARDGFVQLWDHDFDPNFDQPEKAKAAIEQEMHLAGKASKSREADYYYTKRVAERLNTDWSKYKVMGGDFNWNLKEFHDPYALQRNPTFIDIGQNHDAKPTAETTFPCLPGYDILCSKRWFEETTARFSSGYQRPSSGMPQEQIPYSGYVVGINNLMFGENGQERDAQSRDDMIRKYISDCPNFWEKPCLTSTKPQKSDILWVIPAFKRAWSLDLVLKSLSVHEAAKILVSKDADSAEIDSVLKKYTADVINHPWSCSRHPNQFPAKDDTLNENYKGDTYGNPRSPWATCLKHHWWWMMKQAWARNPERVCVLEDDTVIHPQAFEWIARQSGNVKLTPDEIAVPWCMSAKEWQTIEPKAFCEHDDYNWDQTIAWMKEHGHGPNEAAVPSVSLSMHVGDCGGWDAGGRDKACTPQKIVKIRANVEQWLGKSILVHTVKRKWLTAHTKPNGGWGHPKDWAHCLGVAPSQELNNSMKYTVVIPSVKRKNDEYLIKTLDSLERARPADVPVLLVNANQPAVEHKYLRDWCSSHEKYKCIEPPQVSESLIKDVISNDKRGDSEHFLRWRTIETEHALFGLRESLKLHTEYIIWIQDDVIVNKDLFASLVNDDIVCLRDGKDYCGAVAYLFSRKFVSELIPKIESNKLTMPIDWIIFDPRPPEAKYNVPKRIPLITHIGKKSSKHLSKKNNEVKYIRTRTLNPYNMVLHEPPGIVSSELQKTGIWETGITNRFESVFSKKCLNKNFIDIGTNIGYYSLLAASFGHSVLSIEAMEYNLKIYRKSVAMNDFNNIVIEYVGVSDSSGGYLCMEMPKGNAGNGVATFSKTKCKNSVKVKTIDEITAGGYENTIAMKLDIEGFETRALLGAKKFIERVKPCYIWFEYVKEAVIRSGKKPNDIFIFLESMGYIIYDIATPENIVHSIPSAAFLEARHESCAYTYECTKNIQTRDVMFKNERPFVHQNGNVFPKFSSLQRPSITPMKVVSGSIKKCQEAWPTFITKKIKNADIEISVKCSEDVFIDFVDDAEFPKDHMDDWRDISIEERRNATVFKVPNKRQHIKSKTFLLGNHPYVNIQCGQNHNYVARFVPNEKIRKKMLTEMVASNARSIISIKLDSLSNAHAHRTLKKTLKILKNTPGHIEFPFYNSIRGGTAANMLPIFSGQPFTHREARHSVHWLIQKLEQTIWDVANKMGYITSVGGSNGNGIGGSRTLCTRCDHRPPVLPFWTHNWVKNEFFSKNNEKIHRCAGNVDIFEFGLQYISDLFDYASGHPVFAHMGFQDLHTPNPEWALVPSDEILANFISKITNKYPDTIIFIYGDHGRPMAFLTDDENHFEERNGYLAIIDNANTQELLENQQKPIVPWDIHATMLGIITQNGEHKYGIDLRHDSVYTKRTCLEAGLNDSECLFSQYKNKLEIPPVNELTEKIQKIFQNINEENENFEICKSLTPAIILRPTIVYGQIHVNVITHQGPTLWDITGKSVNDLDATQISQWDIFEDCVPHNAKHNACVCKNLESFPVKIGYETNSLPIAFVVMENDYFPSILKYDIDDKQIFTLGNSDTNIIVPETPFENGLNKFIQTMSILLKSISSYCIGFVRGPLQYTKEDFLSYSKCAENILISDSSNIIIFKRDELKKFLYWLENNEDESNIITAIHNYKTKKNNQNVEKINTVDLFTAIDYNAQENSGPWKQGWDYDYDGRFKDGLTVHVVPHSHNDPGWIKTYHTYYSTQTKHILDTVVAALTEDPRRTFIWAEISYFSLWWDDASPQQKEQAKKLVAEKRLDFVTGGWVMNDEASVTARATRWHLQEGREWLKETFGVTPQYSWAIDPFGHSAGQAQVLKELGYKGMLIQRVHYAVKKQLAQKQQLEFQWQTPAGEIFTHMMPFYSYDGPHTCGPDPSVCCQFDFARIGKGKTWTGCPWGKMAVEITEQNVAERSRTWLDQVYKKAMLYRGKHVLIPVGDDFRYQTMDEAHKQYRNYQKMFDWIENNIPAVKVSFSTLSRYFDAQRQTEVPSLQGSFFPYSDREKDYWTGYFNSRIFYKGYDRLLESLIAAAEIKCPAVDIHLQKRALGLFQHHDGITGTAKSAVVQDYYKTMQNAVSKLQSKLKTCLSASLAAHVIVNPLAIDTPTMKANEIRPYEQDKCVSGKVSFENIKVDEHGRLVQINDTPVHESLVWRSNKPGQGVAGAYLMSVTSKEDVLEAKTSATCVSEKYKQVETTFDMLKRRIRVYNDGTVEFIYAVDIHARNNGELWAVYKPEWTAERLCSDVHGLTWECHIERNDAPLQAKFWPMPTMAWLASSSDRMTWTGAQPTGVGFHEGTMVLMLDRRGDQDDARGLGQGITDSRPVEMRFGVVMETEILKERASEKALSVRNWMLNPEIEIKHTPDVTVTNKNTVERTLDQYGYKKCPWMNSPIESRYPRIKSPNKNTWGETIGYNCIKNLVKMQNEGHILFYNYGGFGLSARTIGGWHGNSGDDDIDTKIIYYTEAPYKEKYKTLCNTKISSFGIDYWERKKPISIEQSKYDFKQLLNKERFVQNLSDKELKFFTNDRLCQCEWEGLTLLCMTNSDWWKFQYGFSYWVPLPSKKGLKRLGKNPGFSMSEFLNRQSGEYSQYSDLKSDLNVWKRVDLNGDYEIDPGEFLSYIKTHPEINQKWVNRILDETPCKIYNAYMHYNYTLFYGQKIVAIREQGNINMDIAYNDFKKIFKNPIYLGQKNHVKTRLVKTKYEVSYPNILYDKDKENEKCKNKLRK